MLFRLIAIICIVLLSTGCSSYKASGNIFSKNDTRTSYDVAYGEVLSIKEVKIEGDSSFIGTWGGAQIGRDIGQKVGDRRRNPIAGSVGAIAGAAAGKAIEKELTSEVGIEIMIKMDNGNTIAVIQSNEGTIDEGDRVKVLFGSRGEARVASI